MLLAAQSPWRLFSAWCRRPLQRAFPACAGLYGGGLADTWLRTCLPRHLGGHVSRGRRQRPRRALSWWQTWLLGATLAVLALVLPRPRLDRDGTSHPLGPVGRAAGPRPPVASRRSFTRCPWTDIPERSGAPSCALTAVRSDQAPRRAAARRAAGAGERSGRAVHTGGGPGQPPCRPGAYRPALGSPLMAAARRSLGAGPLPFDSARRVRAAEADLSDLPAVRLPVRCHRPARPRRPRCPTAASRGRTAHPWTRPGGAHRHSGAGDRLNQAEPPLLVLLFGLMALHTRRCSTAPPLHGVAAGV